MNEFLAEVIGTFILILFGDGVVANVVLKDTKGHNGALIYVLSFRDYYSSEEQRVI